MANDDENRSAPGKTTPVNGESDPSTSNSASDEDTSSTPNTPPSPNVNNRANNTTPTPTSIPVVPPYTPGTASATLNGSPASRSTTPTTSASTTPASSNPSKRRNSLTPKSRLGAIDEDSDKVSPDLPVRNPRRKIGVPASASRLWHFAIPPTLLSKNPTPKLYDDVQGPNGEKFNDVRENNGAKPDSLKSPAWKRAVCILMLVVIVVALAAVGLIAGLLTRKHKQDTQNAPSNNSTTPSTGEEAFPAGKFAITSYLTNATTSCTSNPSTWRCYPYSTYNQSSSNSLSTINWVISTTNVSSTSTNPSQPDYVITSSDSTFSYPFQSIPLRLTNKGAANEAYTFTYSYDKFTIPSTAITNDGTNARCYFNNTLLTGTLYTKIPKVAALSQASNSTSTGGDFQPWPYALEFIETIASGNNVPNCYKYVNGENGERVDVPVLAAGSAGDCACGYQNYDVS